MQEVATREAAARKEMQACVDEENRRATLARRSEDAERADDDARADAEEQHATTASALVSEDWAQAVGRGGRRVVQSWKGMTDEERQSIVEERRRQADEAKRANAEEAERERRDAAERRKAAAEAIRRERAEARQQQQEARTRAAGWLADADVARQREHEEHAETYGSDQPADEFWSYFGRSHR
jgi:hypothetical protein